MCEGERRRTYTGEDAAAVDDVEVLVWVWVKLGVEELEPEGNPISSIAIMRRFILY